MGTVRFVFALLAISLLAACAEPAKVASMTTQNFAGGAVAADPQLVGALSVGTVTGGEETDPLWTSEVDGPSFKAALEQSLLTNALLNRDPAQSPYRVEAHLGELDQPFAGFTLTVSSTVQYRVIDSATETLWFEREVRANGVAGTGDAFRAVDRLRIANERAIQTNIQQFITAFIEEWKKRPATTS
jgi:hypothetical protein